ncbi:MAG: T9SS type A sorting domain-containing protein [Ferruginibacter sp.]|nr:T9SS type A sorting domain-containing protein [Ferruginibacter sp.]
MNRPNASFPLLELFRGIIQFSIKAIFAGLVLFNVLTSNAQVMKIGTGGRVILNGNVSLVVNNAALENNGHFSAGNSTVSFRGHLDTVNSFISGTATTTFNELSIIKSAYGVALKSPVIVRSVLSVTGGKLYTDSNLTLKSDATLTARVAAIATGSQVIGKTNVQRYMAAQRAWRLLTAPVTGSETILKTWQNNGVFATGSGMLITGPAASGVAGNGLDYSAQNAVSMKSYNYSNGQYVNVINTKIPLSAGVTGSADNTGYFVFVRGDRDPNNTSVSSVNATVLTSIGSLQTGNQVFTASPVAGAFTLIGNPYASPIDFNLVSRTNLIKRFYVWDPNLNSVGGYVMLDDLNNDGVFATTIGGSSQTKEIQSGQAFFVETLSTSPAALTFMESSKSTGTSNVIFRPQSPTGQQPGQLNASLYLLNATGANKLADGVLAEFDDSYAAGINREDALKFSNSNENLMIVRNNVSLIAERRPALSINDTIFFKLSNTTQRDYQFIIDSKNLNQPGITGYLEDNFLGTRKAISLSGATVINFSISPQTGSAAANRFRIVFRQDLTVLPVTITRFRALAKGKNIDVQWEVENELNIDRYDLEKRMPATGFEKVFTVKVQGNNNAHNSYAWTDIKPAAGINYFRIKKYDRSGSISYSHIEKVNIALSTSGVTIYPNPVTGTIINLRVTQQNSGVCQVEIFNASGQRVLRRNFSYSNGEVNKQIETHSKLPTGIYQLKTTLDGDEATYQQLIIQ